MRPAWGRDTSLPELLMSLLAVVRIMLLLLVGIAGEIVISMVVPPLTGRDYAIGAAILVGCILTYAWILREHYDTSRLSERER